MRALGPPPVEILDPATRSPRYGAYDGPLPRVDLRPFAPTPLHLVTRHKRWVYAAVASDELFVATAIVHLGYAANAFAFAHVRGERALAAHRSLLAAPFFARVGDTADAGCDARFAMGRVSMRFQRRPGDSKYALDVGIEGLRVHAQLDAAEAPPPIAVIGRVPGGTVNATEKRALLPVAGEATVAGKRYRLSDAFGGFDYTNGLLARRTSWRWVFAMGRARSGERVALNLVEGFVGEPECVVWVGGAIHGVGEGRFTFRRQDPLAPWAVRTADGSVDLVFEPAAMHADDRDLVLVASRFVQPVGTFRGTITLPDRAPLELEAVPGVVEDQDVLW